MKLKTIGYHLTIISLIRAYFKIISLLKLEIRTFAIVLSFVFSEPVLSQGGPATDPRRAWQINSQVIHTLPMYGLKL